MHISFIFMQLYLKIHVEALIYCHQVTPLGGITWPALVMACSLGVGTEFASRHYTNRRRLRSRTHTMTSSNGNIFRVTGHLCGEFTGDWWIPHTKASDAGLWCFDLRLNKRLSKQLLGRLFETPSCSIWRHCNVYWYMHVSPGTEKDLTHDAVLTHQLWPWNVWPWTKQLHEQLHQPPGKADGANIGMIGWSVGVRSYLLLATICDCFGILIGREGWS